MKKTDKKLEMYCEGLNGRQWKFIVLIFYLQLWSSPVVSGILILYACGLTAESPDLRRGAVIHEVIKSCSK